MARSKHIYKIPLILIFQTICLNFSNASNNINKNSNSKAPRDLENSAFPEADKPPRFSLDNPYIAECEYGHLLKPFASNTGLVPFGLIRQPALINRKMAIKQNKLLREAQRKRQSTMYNRRFSRRKRIQIPYESINERSENFSDNINSFLPQYSNQKGRVDTDIVNLTSIDVQLDKEFIHSFSLADEKSIPKRDPLLLDPATEIIDINEKVKDLRLTYMPNLNCNWEIEIPEHNVLHFWFKYFRLEFYSTDASLDKGIFNHACRYDYLRLINNYNVHSKPGEPQGDYVFQFCHTLVQNHFYLVSATNKVLLQFITDKDTENFGFEMYYEFLDFGDADLAKESLGNFTMDVIEPVDPRARDLSPNERTGKSLLYITLMIPLFAFLTLACHNIQKQTEQFEQERNALFMGNLPGGDTATEAVSRAQTALMTGLLQRRPSVLELSRRLLQEEQILVGRQRAARDQPPSYENMVTGISSAITRASRSRISTVGASATPAAPASEVPDGQIIRGTDQDARAVGSQPTTGSSSTRPNNLQIRSFFSRLYEGQNEVGAVPGTENSDGAAAISRVVIGNRSNERSPRSARQPHSRDTRDSQSNDSIDTMSTVMPRQPQTGRIESLGENGDDHGEEPNYIVSMSRDYFQRAPDFFRSRTLSESYSRQSIQTNLPGYDSATNMPHYEDLSLKADSTSISSNVDKTPISTSKSKMSTKISPIKTGDYLHNGSSSVTVKSVYMVDNNGGDYSERIRK